MWRREGGEETIVGIWVANGVIELLLIFEHVIIPYDIHHA